MQKAKAFAFTIILVMMVVNFVLPRPVVPTFPHKSWKWLTPWPVQDIEGSRPSGTTRGAVKADTADEINEKIILVLIGVAATVFLENLTALNEALFGYLNDVFLGTAPGTDGGGGGGGGGVELEMNF